MKTNTETTSKNKMELEELKKEYISSILTKTETNNFLRIVNIVSEFIYFFQSLNRKIKTLEDITSEDSRFYYEHLRKTYKDQKIINEHVKEVSYFIFFADDNEIIDINNRWNSESK